MQALEITTFRLLNTTFQVFIEANISTIDPWLKRQKGFQSRHIIQESDGGIMDLVFWDSAKQGADAMHRIMSETADSPVHGMIDHSTVSWNIYNIAHRS